MKPLIKLTRMRFLTGSIACWVCMDRSHGLGSFTGYTPKEAYNSYARCRDYRVNNKRMEHR